MSLTLLVIGGNKDIKNNFKSEEKTSYLDIRESLFLMTKDYSPLPP